MVDGLHEDLNLRKSKPYIKNPESENRNITDLGFEAYSNSLRRDWSFISFLFNGQTQSNLECLSCHKQSITFEILSSIPLSLPEPLAEPAPWFNFAWILVAIAVVFYLRLSLMIALGMPLFVIIGAAASLGPVIDFSDASIFAMAVVNIIGLYFLMPIVKRELRSYNTRLKSGEIKKFK